MRRERDRIRFVKRRFRRVVRIFPTPAKEPYPVVQIGEADLRGFGLGLGLGLGLRFRVRVIVRVRVRVRVGVRGLGFRD